MATGLPKTKWRNHANGSSMMVSDNGQNRQGMDYILHYAGKKPHHEVLATPPDQPRWAFNVGESSANPWRNRLYVGDNLGILAHLLRDPSVCGKVRLVYIDPPFATRMVFQSRAQSDAYADLLSGAAYLEFLRQRLIFLWELLASDGSLYVHLDENMVFPVKIILDEIFGPSNFRNCITRKKCSAKNYTRKTYGNVADSILFYTKSDNYVWNRPFEAWTPERIAKEYPYVDEATGRLYKRVPLHAPGVRHGETGKTWRDMSPPPGKHWQFPPATLEEMDKRGEIYWSPNGNPRRKVFLDQSEGIPVQDIWLEFRDAHNQNVHVTGYPTEKNPNLLARMIGASSQAGDLVLDCFCGSGTTVAVAEMMGRRWLGVDNSPEAVTTTLTRLAKGTQPMGDFVGKRGNGQSQTQPQSAARTLFAEEDVPTVETPQPIRAILRSSLDFFIAESAAATVTPETLAGWRHLFEAPPTARELRTTYSIKSYVTPSQNKRKVTLQEKSEGRTQ